MKTILITAMHSGAGKTVMSCALLAALKRRGVRPQAFKCGPDYLDPMFHSRVLGLPCRNLDLFLQGERGVKRTLGRCGAELALIEGAMGYYDGVNDSDRASAYALHRLTGAPAILVLRPAGAPTLAAQLRGMLDYRPDSGIAGLLLSDCPARLAERLGPALERETGLPLLGFLPPMDAARLESRHLGLLRAAELADFSARMEALAEQAERSIELSRLLALCQEYRAEPLPPAATAASRCRIAVARDEAFCFCYADTLDALCEAGAELCFFSPLRDPALPPEADGLYLPGGYPELHARTLSENTALRRCIAEALSRELPCVAECGGFLYLQRSLEDESGTDWPMCGVLPGRGFGTGRLQRFGYLHLHAAEDSLLFRAGEAIPAHEFHYWDSTENGDALRAVKPDGRAWACGRVSKTQYAAFPHLHFGGETPLAERFVGACEAWKRSKSS